MEPSNIIKVVVEHREEIRADHADVYVVIKGSSLVTGHAALSKAREVNQLVTGLTELGVVAEDIKLESVHAQVASGILNKSSSAMYSLRIRCGNLEMLADILGTVTSQKNINLRGIVWGYPEEAVNKDNWLDLCLEQAHSKARRIAKGLGTNLVGIHNYRDTYADSETIRSRSGKRGMDDLDAELYQMADMFEDTDEQTVKRRKVAGDNLGMEVSHTKKAILRVEVEYLVSGYSTQ